MQPKRLLSLHVQILLAVLLGLLIGGGVFAAAVLALDAGVDRVYMRDDAIESRYQRYLASFQEYVTKNDLKSTDFSKLEDWCPDNVYLVIYQDGKPIYTSAKIDDPSQFRVLRVSEVTYADGTAQTSLLDYTEGRLYNLSLVIAFAAGCLALILVVLVYHGRLEQDVLRLSDEITKIGAGNLQQQVTIRGCSEMTQLQMNVDKMRRSLQQQIQNEERAWRSNRELITSLSHDLRSPLTAMIGYLELIRDRKPDEEILQYADACMAKALQLKTMSDELFRYFLVYDEARLNLQLERYDAATLLGQMLGEQVLLAQEQGLHFRLSMPQKLGDILVDPQYLQRLFDNLFSNLQKYAEPSREITVTVTRPAGKVQIVLHNFISHYPEKPESSGIGVATCQRIVQAMGGIMQVSSQRNTYTTQIRLPGAPAEPLSKTEENL